MTGLHDGRQEEGKQNNAGLLIDMDEESTPGDEPRIALDGHVERTYDPIPVHQGVLERDAAGGWEFPWETTKTTAKYIQFYNPKYDPSEIENLESIYAEVVEAFVNEVANALHDGRTPPGENRRMRIGRIKIATRWASTHDPTRTRIS